MRKVRVPEAGVSTLFGAYDDNLRQLESLLNVRIRTQGHELMVEGDAANTAKVARLVEQLGELIDQGHSISDRDVKTAAQLVAEDSAVDLREHFLKDGQLRTAGKRRIAAKSANQRRYLEGCAIEVAPLAFMRGRTLNDAFVILDEAQNTTTEQMKMFLTRLGFGSKAVVTGDVTQIDLPGGRMSGLVQAMEVVGKVEGISFVYFDERDVVRHKLVQAIVKAYDAYGSG